MSIVWNKTAEDQWYSIAIKIFKDFGKPAVVKFEADVNKWQVYILANPEIAPPEPLLNNRKYRYRSIVIHKYCKLVYYINNHTNNIHIAALWDTRRNPNSIHKNV